MNTISSERRRESVKQLLSQSLRLGFFFVTDSIEAMAHVHLKLAGAGHLKCQMVKVTPAGAGIESRLIGPIADQVITFLLSQHAANPAAQIVRILDGPPARLVRPIIKA